MKSNAILRIIIWSLLLLILVSILVSGLVYRGHRLSGNPPAETVVPVKEAPAMPVESDDLHLEAVVTATAVNVRSAPSGDARIVGMVEQGDVVTILRAENCNGKEWIMIFSPITGWMVAEYVDSIEDVVFHSSEPSATSDSNIYLNTKATAIDVLPVYSAPSADTTTTAALEKGTVVTIGRQEAINGMNWTYILEPTSGWVPTDLLQNAEDASENITFTDISLDAKQIREIDIEWAAGNISIRSADVDTIQFWESEPAEPKDAMVWKQHNDKLTIRFSETNNLDFNLGITLTDVIDKDLTILVPMGWECDSLEVDAASATLTVQNLVIGEVDFDGASGTCDFENCVVDELDLDTASGDIHFSGSLKTLDCDAASASVIAVFDNVPERIDMDSMSGDLDITLPSAAGFRVTMDGLSTDFTSDFGYAQNKDGSFYRGNGACRITMDAMSGDIYIREFKEANAAADTVAPTDSNGSGTHHHTDACSTNPDSCPDYTPNHTEPHHN